MILMKKIPLLDLGAQHKFIEKELYDAIRSVINSSEFIRGSQVELFEKNFSALLNVDYCISCGNGTDALYLTMLALGLKPGDEVIVPAHSWISTSETVTQAGGKVVFVDTDKDTFTLAPALLQDYITEKTVGIIPVHLYGHPADMDGIMSVANANNLWVIEDCAQAHLSRFAGKFVGTFGDAATFSFYPGKNLGAMGDAGAVLSNNRDLAIKIAKLARHGGLTKGEHEIEGMNSRMDSIQAAILNVKLKYLKKWTTERQEIAAILLNELGFSKKYTTPIVAKNSEHVWHQFVLKTSDRDGLAKHMLKHGVSTGIHYPTALPFLKAYERLKHKFSDFPNAAHNQGQILSIPCYPELTDHDINRIVGSIKSYA